MAQKLCNLADAGLDLKCSEREAIAQRPVIKSATVVAFAVFWRVCLQEPLKHARPHKEHTANVADGTKATKVGKALEVRVTQPTLMGLVLVGVGEVERWVTLYGGHEPPEGVGLKPVGTLDYEAELTFGGSREREGTRLVERSRPVASSPAYKLPMSVALLLERGKHVIGVRCQHRDQGRLAIANKFREAPPLTSKHFGRDPLREEPVLVGRVLARIEHAPAARVIYALRHERQHAAEGLDRMVVLCHTRVSLWPFTQRDHEEQLFHILWQHRREADDPLAEHMVLF